DRSFKQTASIIEDAAKANVPAGSDQRKIADLYKSYMDESAIESHGLATLKPHLAEIAAIHTPRELAHALGLTLSADVDALNNTNNPCHAADFPAKAPGLDWPEFFRAAGLDQQDTVIVWQPTAITGEAALVSSQSIDGWKDLLAYHLIEAYASSTSKALADERFAFFGTTLSGATQQRPRDFRGDVLVSAP